MKPGSDLRFDLIPTTLTTLPQWVLWKTITRDGKPTKVPFAIEGEMAKSNDPATWGRFEEAVDVYERGGYDGIGFMFREGGGIVGIDLDGCRDPETLAGEPWAKEIVEAFGTYAEVSPSGSGVKLFVLGQSPFDGGRKRAVEGARIIGGKQPAIEVYDKLRYFAVTGWKVGEHSELQARPEALAWLKQAYFAPPPPPPPAAIQYSGSEVVIRARKYLASIDGAVSGQGGHNQTFRAACHLVLGFELSESEALSLLAEWNAKCVPPWSEKELRHKVSQAAKQSGIRGYLKNQPLHKINLSALPSYECPSVTKEIVATTLESAAKERVEQIKRGERKLVTTGIPPLDTALEGGIDFGEYVIFAARPSHGKSTLALQGVHAWTNAGYPVLFISQEMSQEKLGERALQFLSDAPKEHWDKSVSQLTMEIDNHFRDRAPCYVVNDVASAEDAIALVEKYITEHGVKIVVVDYAQILKGKGRDDRERVSTTSLIMRQWATNKKIIVIALCQINRSVEGRGAFLPKESDIKDSGQLEQDADVIVSLCWTYKIDKKADPKEYMLFVNKNRNRAIVNHIVKCWFHPSRQMITREEQYAAAEDSPGYTPDFTSWNNGDGQGSF